MKKYLIKGFYTSEGTKGLLTEGGSGRRSAIEKMLSIMNGKIESFYYALGKEEVYLIISLPDDITAAAIALRVNAAGLVKISITNLLAPEDIDAASKLTVSYRAPGQ